MRTLITAVLLLVPSLTSAGDSAWLGPDRKQWPDTEFRKTRNDFAAMLLVNKPAHVRCRSKVTRPNKTVSVNQRGIPCLDGELKGDPNSIRLAPAVISLSAKRPTRSASGWWMWRSRMRRNTKLPLRTRFTLSGARYRPLTADRSA